MLYFRLFIVGGVSWTFEIVSIVIPYNASFFILADLLNSSQGILIFVLFIMKPRVLRAIKKR